eukprot:gene22472-biopygen1177
MHFPAVCNGKKAAHQQLGASHVGPGRVCLLRVLVAPAVPHFHLFYILAVPAAPQSLFRPNPQLLCVLRCLRRRRLPPMSIFPSGQPAPPADECAEGWRANAKCVCPVRLPDQRLLARPLVCREVGSRPAHAGKGRVLRCWPAYLTFVSVGPPAGTRCAAELWKRVHGRTQSSSVQVLHTSFGAVYVRQTCALEAWGNSALARVWRGHGAGVAWAIGILLAWGGAGVARAWGGRGTGMSCSPCAFQFV